MFEATDIPRVFAVPVGCDFSKTFLAGLRSRITTPEGLARVEIFVNTQRMARRLKELLAQDGAVLLPKIRVITDIAKHPNLPVVLPEPVSKLRRELMLAQAVGQLLNADETVAPQSAKFDLAKSLAGVLDEMQGEGIPISTLKTVDVESHSEHWDRSLRFLNILADHWNNDAPTDPQDRQRAAANAFTAHWAEHPATHPVLAIGSTGSRAETALFMRAVAALPQGAVVLPGLDRAMDAGDWARLTDDDVSADHPQTALAHFCAGAGIGFNDIQNWTNTPVANEARNKVISLALRPAPFTDQWLDRGPALASEMDQAMNGVTLIEAETPKEEALALALRLRAAAQNDQSAVLITPDRTLTRRVSAVLSRWKILPDDSAGTPLHLTPPGVFLRMVAGAMGGRLTPLSLVSLLKHPLSDSGAQEGSSKLILREYEKSKLRGGAPFVDFDGLREWADQFKEQPERRVWADWVVRCFQPLEDIAAGGLDTFLEVLLATSEALASGPSLAETHELWKEETGREAKKACEQLTGEADAAGPLSVPDFQALFRSVLAAGTVREARASHPKISIWGTLEARVEAADVVILGGLNDTVWPGVENPDPWLNRGMRAQVGLSPPERVIGLSAHDFQQGCGAAELVLSRSVRDGDAPTVASRWMVRLLNLMNGLQDDGKAAVKSIKARGQLWLDYARQMDRAQSDARMPAPRPAPMPPADKRLKQLSVTQVERLIRDPYAIYAAKILELRRLDPLGREPDALIRGIALHKVVETFVETFPDALPDDARGALLNVAEEVLKDEVPWPAMQRVWLARLARIAGWFVEGEAQRRTRASDPKQEKTGSREIADLGFELTAKADRIDRTDDGGLVIYDYKSGSPPSKAQTDFFNKQLQLEAAIAHVGGFSDVPQGEPVALEYIGLSGSAQGAEGKVLALETSGADADAVWQEFGQLVREYADAEKGFPARTRMEQMAYAYEFDHLARKGEWEESDAPVDIAVGRES